MQAKIKVLFEANTPLNHYLAAILSVFVALWLSSLLWEVIANSRFLLFTLAVVLSARYGGLWPGVLAAALSIFAADYFLLDPHHQLNAMPADVVAFGVFGIVALTISGMQAQRLHTMQDTRQTNEALQGILDALPLLVGLMSIDGKLTQINRTALTIAGLSQTDVIGQSFDETYWWSYSVKSQERLRAAISKARAGEFVRYDVDIRVSEDQYRTIDFMISPVKDAEGNVVHLVPAALDITERKRRELEFLHLTMLLENERRRLNSVVASVPGVVYVSYDEADAATQKMDFISQYAETLLGYPVADWYSEPNYWKAVVHPEDWERAVSEANAIYASGEHGAVQFRCITQSGEVVHVEAHSAAIHDDDGAQIGTCGVVMDITDRKHIEAQLLRYTEELRRSNEELEQFAYVASHDLQEPLRMVTSYLQLIEQRYADKLDDDAREFIDFAVDGATRMKQLINDLLSYSRVQRSKREFEPINIGDILRQVCDNLRLSIEDNGATITHDDLPQVTANAAQMAQLLQNLIGNAIKFRRDEPPQIHIGAQRQRDEWHFRVSDNGIGIQPQYTERIFVIFQRLHAREQYAGTGIGLAICKKIIEKHGGRIWLESEPDNGTTFHFTLPFDSSSKRSLP
ncbi:MAG: PAS domain S-box protein [Anaerolineaceae bacterium]|nr:MAG: PAS domain S-box protein [Anaerolineaceae bacterium]